MRTMLTYLLACCTAMTFGSPVPANSARGAEHPFSAELQHLHTVIAAAEKSGQKKILLNSLRELRDLQSRSGALDSALRTGLRAVHLSGYTTDRAAMAADWTALARIDQRAANLPEAVTAAKRAFLVLKTTNNRQLMQAARLDLLELLLEAGRYPEFKHQSEQALTAFKSTNERAAYARVRYLQGKCLTQQGKAIDALSILHLALRDSSALKDERQVARIHFALAEANARAGQWVAAEKAFNQALRLDPKAPGNTPGLYGLCGQIREALGDPSGALQCERRQTRAKDSLLSARMSDRMVRMKTMYAVQAMDKEIGALHVRDQEVTAELAKEQWKLRLAMLLSAGLSVGLLMLLMLRGRVLSRARRARLRSDLVASQAKQVHSKSLELERQNLRLTQAMMGECPIDATAGSHFPGCTLDLVGLLVQVGRNHAENEQTATVLAGLYGRIEAMTLVGEHLNMEASRGRINLKAHVMALADSLLRKHDLQQQIQVELDIAYEDPSLHELLRLSLLLNELFSMSMEHGVDGAGPRTISVALRRLGTQQSELLYSDGSGAISAANLGNGSLSAELVQLWSKSLKGSIMLLKSETTTFQLTFQPGAAESLRKAS